MFIKDPTYVHSLLCCITVLICQMTLSTDLTVMTPDGKRVVTAQWGCMDIWQLNALGIWQLIGKGILADELDSVTCLAITDDGQRFVSSSTDGIIRVWQQIANELRWAPIVSLNTPDKDLIYTVEIAKDGKRVVASCYGTVIQTWGQDAQDKWHTLGAVQENEKPTNQSTQERFFPGFYGDFYIC